MRPERAYLLGPVPSGIGLRDRHTPQRVSRHHDLGVDRSTAWRRWQIALTKIAARLNAR